MRRLSLAVGDYDINRGLIDGSVAVEGCETTVLTMPSPERHWRFMRHGEFDACELSLCSYLASLRQGRLTAVPCFPHRRFRHHYVFVRADAGVRGPRDLEGRSVGLRTWQTTAGMWMRGILQHDYGVDLQRVRWVTHGEEDVPEAVPAAPVERGDRDPERMLLDGELDAVLYPETLPSFRRGDPRVARLFPDPKAEEQAYYRRTGVFPIMHLVAVRREVAEADPWLPRNLLQAFERSKRLAYRRMENPRSVSLAWFTALYEEERALLGPDPWEYGLTEANRRNLAAALRYAHEQGILAQPAAPEDLFWPPTLDAIPEYVGG
jgi:4,5-dihydroxyphthalate decarboxylase